MVHGNKAGEINFIDDMSSFPAHVNRKGKNECGQDIGEGHKPGFSVLLPAPGRAHALR